MTQPLKALSPIELAAEPIKREVKPEQAENAEDPIEVTALGMSREPLSPLQPEKTDVPIVVITAGIVSEPVRLLQF